MLTYEDVTAFFLKAAASLNLVTHPEYWTNGRTLEREFACVCHTGPCDETETGNACTLSFTWSTLDTALSLEGPAGVCDFFHEPDEHCPHLHTSDIPPLVLDLSYMSPLNGSGATISEATLLSLAQMLKLRASELSSRTIETRSGVNMGVQENRLQPEALTLQQRVELPIWHPNGMRGLHDEPHSRSIRSIQRHRPAADEEEEDEVEVVADDPRPEDWLPQVMIDVCQDIVRVLDALDAVRAHKNL
ncbi:MAG TPA: hypothetical protein VGT44_08810 [Ktedonobacteraceae bacterium]|nr:hypothetical protein [Ktedonobacteraceae bacterium]